MLCSQDSQTVGFPECCLCVVFPRYRGLGSGGLAHVLENLIHKGRGQLTCVFPERLENKLVKEPGLDKTGSY